MKTAQQFIEEFLNRKITDEQTYIMKVSDMKELMKAYTMEAINQILARPEMIHVDDDEGIYDFLEALYNYELFSEFKKQLP